MYKRFVKVTFVKVTWPTHRECVSVYASVREKKKEVENHM